MTQVPKGDGGHFITGLCYLYLDPVFIHWFFKETRREREKKDGRKLREEYTQKELAK